MQRTTGGAWPSVYAQCYSYDRWGNRWINAPCIWGANIFNTVITPNSANNRLTGMTYDSAGNTSNDPITGGGARTYDADNRMISAQSGATWNYYVYDADGKRVRRIVNGIETWHVYGFSGELLAEYSVNGATGSPLKEYERAFGSAIASHRNSSRRYERLDDAEPFRHAQTALGDRFNNHTSTRTLKAPIFPWEWR